MGHVPRILVVDDNADNRDLLALMLRRQGYEAATATTGAEALAAVMADPPAAILLDIMMPDLDGYEVARRIKSDPALPFIPIILVTAKSDPQDKIHGLEQGADDYLSKPVVGAELLARVRALLRLKAAQDALQARNDQLRDLEAQRENLVQMITHDLRGPLTGLLGALELIADGSLGPVSQGQQPFVSQSLQNCRTMSDMLNDLLDVYRLEAGRLALEARPVALHPLAEQACVQVAPAVAGKRLTLHNAIAPDLPPVQGDGDKLGRVLANLLMNAFKYTAQGAITLSAELSEDNGHPYAPPGEGQPPLPGRRYAVVSVQDTGVGIPAAIRPRIFSKFDRGTEGSGGAIRGAGLGLYFARQMVEAHGGNIWVEAAPAEGPGSVFRFSVPLQES